MKPYKPAYYRDYLSLDAILNAQSLRSAEYNNDQESAHDEMLFIITHQAYELWFKQMLTELDSILALMSQQPLPEPDVALVLHRLQRMNKIGPVMLHQVEILETMTPMDFLDFRGVLYPASGFQSVQFRLLEMKLGLQDSQRLTTHLRLDDRDNARLDAVRQQPSLFALLEGWLERMPFLEWQHDDNGNDDGNNQPRYAFWQEYRLAVTAMFDHERQIMRETMPDERTTAQVLAQIAASEQSFSALFDETTYNSLREQGVKRLSFKATQAALFIFLYREYPLLQLPFRLLESVIALDEVFSLWRYRHAQMVLRMIGARIGTGGSSGYDYLLQGAMKYRVFADMSALSAFLIPRRSLPALPPNVSSMLGFSFEK